MYLNALGQPIIVLNSLKVAFELLDRRANINSSRHHSIVSFDIFCGGLFTALMPYGDLYAPFPKDSEVIVISRWTRAMITQPWIQKRAQDELDALVGRSRTPTFADAPICLISRHWSKNLFGGAPPSH
jgi:hypothetical protein